MTAVIRRHALWSVLLLGGCAPAAVPAPAPSLPVATYPPGISPPDAAPQEFMAAGQPRGEQLYATFCVTCHGTGGRGDGRAAPFTRVPPADFTRAEFRVRSTPFGLPADSDLEHVIRMGTGADGAMPGFPFLSASDIRALVVKVQSFSPRWRLERRPPPLPSGSVAAPPPPAPVRPHASIDTSTVSAYWREPIQAATPGISSPSCAACHPQQFADWSRSRHALAMGPGVFAQMQEPASGGGCARCHAPLREQARDAYLVADGVSCAACHVREGQVFGPAPTPTTLLPLVSTLGQVHGTIQTRPFFEQPEFCSGCHHLPAGTAPSVQGTTLQNTYEEWRNSRAAREGRTCQSCHMPDRRHLFRGIHDPDTVRQALRWTFDATPGADGPQATITLTNVGAGHHVPTYVVPEIWMRIDVRSGAGVMLASVEHRIARKVRFENGVWTQTSDTRLAPDASARLEFTDPLPRGAASIVGRVIVLPDLWQAEKFRERLASAASDELRRHYRAALDEASASGYTLYESERRLGR
jgi:mono/diheme cytochrome c family protein